MSGRADLRGALLQAAAAAGLALPEEQGGRPEIVFTLAERDGCRGDLSTPWAFSLGDSPAGACRIAERLAAQDPHWQAENGYLNIRLTDRQLAAVIDRRAGEFSPEVFLDLHPDDSHTEFLREYCLYRTAWEYRSAEIAPFSRAEEGDRFLCVLIVHADLGAADEFLLREMYRCYRNSIRLPAAVAFAAAALLQKNV